MATPWTSGTERWRPASAALHASQVEFQNGGITADAFRDSALRTLEELAASSPEAAELLGPALEGVRHAPAEKLTTRVSLLAAAISEIADTNCRIDEGHVRPMGP